MNKNELKATTSLIIVDVNLSFCELIFAVDSKNSDKLMCYCDKKLAFYDITTN